GMPVDPSMVELSRHGGFGVAHVVLAPEGVKEGATVQEFDLKGLHEGLPGGLKGDLWIFGKPTAYPGRRMGLAFSYAASLENARENAEKLAHMAETKFVYKV
ncbi:MAG: hypothetical protein ABC588_09140, partial [Candidatus Methanosuratincola petrocarbonis]